MAPSIFSPSTQPPPPLLSPKPFAPRDAYFLNTSSSSPSNHPSALPSRLPSPTDSDTSTADNNFRNAVFGPNVFPPSPIASPDLPSYTLNGSSEKASLINLPTELLLSILNHLSLDSEPNRANYDALYASREKRRVPLLSKETKNALAGTCRGLRDFIMAFGAFETLRLSSITGIASLHSSNTAFDPATRYAKKLVLRWRNSGRTHWAPGAEEMVWNDVVQGWQQVKDTRPRIVIGKREEAPALRADMVNLSGRRPTDEAAYWRECRRYISPQSMPAHRDPVPHCPNTRDDLLSILASTQALEELVLDFPGAIKYFTEAVMALPDDAGVLRTLKKLEVRNGSERAFPPPKELFVAVARFMHVEDVSLTGGCGGRKGVVHLEGREKRGVYNGDEEVDWWGWDCEAVAVAEKPQKLAKCEVLGLAGLQVDEERSRGVWSGRGWVGESTVVGVEL